MSTKSYLVLRSDDRDKDQDPSPSEIYFTSQISYFSNTGISEVEGESFNMFYDIPNINERNNVLVLEVGASSFPVTVPEGSYNHISLGTALAVQLNTLGLGAFACAWVPITQKFELTCPVLASVAVYPPLKRDLAKVMGFTYGLAPSLTIDGNSADLSYTRDIYVVSDTMHRNKRNDDQASSNLLNNILMIVPVYGSTIVDRSNSGVGTGKEYYLNPRNIFYQPHVTKKIAFNRDEAVSNINIRLYDDQGEQLYNPHGKDSYRYRISMLLRK